MAEKEIGNMQQIIEIAKRRDGVDLNGYKDIIEYSSNFMKSVDKDDPDYDTINKIMGKYKLYDTEISGSASPRTRRVLELYNEEKAAKEPENEKLADEDTIDKGVNPLDKKKKALKQPGDEEIRAFVRKWLNEEL